MKTEITIDGITYKVGDVLERETYHDREILYIGNKEVFVRLLSEEYETTVAIEFLKHWKIKKPKKKLVIERWINVCEDGITYTWSSEELSDKYASRNRIACEHVKFEYFIDE